MNKQELYKLAKTVVAKVAQRDLVLLPLPNNGNADPRGPSEAILPVRYSYRASSDGWVEYQLYGEGELGYELFPMAHEKGKAVTRGCRLSCRTASVKSGDILRVCITDPKAEINGQVISADNILETALTRRYIAHVTIKTGSNVRKRVCSHYLPFDHKEIGKDYYFGDDYSDYLDAVNPQTGVSLVRKYCQSGRVLDIGCALGLYTRSFKDAGFDAYGIDISEYAIGEAAKRIGPERARQCNPDKEEIPFEGKFDVMWLWDVLEHSAGPKALLEKMTRLSNSGAWLFLHTSNADSLTHLMMGADWEGYSDYSHFGVDQISAKSLRSWLKESGWEIISWQCEQIWFSGVDPAMSRFRDVFHRLPELAVLLSERDLGDFITVVARRV